MICIKCNEDVSSGVGRKEGFTCHSCWCQEKKEDVFCCKECGKYDSPSEWSEGTSRQEMVAEGICFSCQYWYEKIRAKDKPNIAIIENCFFAFDPPNKINPKRGTIYKDGKVFDYGFLGNGSRIPLHFRDRLPNNASFGS